MAGSVRSNQPCNRVANLAKEATLTVQDGLTLDKDGLVTTDLLSEFGIT